MGICKCRKRTDLFCFVHKKAVCEACICSDHQVCVVKSYFDWLSEPEYETPVCGVCKGELSADNMVRFLCLDMFHPECIDVYASSLPANTALAGYTCPTCDKPMLPTPDNTSVLAQQIKKTFGNSPWATRVLGAEESNIDLDVKDPLDPLSYHPAPSQTPYDSTTINIDQPSASTYGMASHRKATKPLGASIPSLYPLDDEDEDKYRKKGFMQLFAALGLVNRPASLDGKRGGIDPKVLTLLFAGLATFIILVFLYYAIFSDTDPITTEIE